MYRPCKYFSLAKVLYSAKIELVIDKVVIFIEMNSISSN